MTVRWDLAWASDFLSSSGEKASQTRVWRTEVGLVRVSTSWRLSHQCHHQWGWAGCVVIPALQGGSMPWGNTKPIAFFVAFLSHLEKVWCSLFSLATRKSTPSQSVKDGPCSSTCHPSPSSFCQELWKGLEWGQRTTPCSAWVFWGLSYHHRDLPLGGMLDKRIQQCVCSIGVLPLPKYLSTWWIRSPYHCGRSYSTDTMLCFLELSVLLLNYSAWQIAKWRSGKDFAPKASELCCICAAWFSLSACSVKLLALHGSDIDVIVLVLSRQLPDTGEVQ